MPFVRLSDHIYQVGGKGLSHTLDCNIYLIDGRPQECILVDCGTPFGTELLLDNISEAGFDLGQVAAVVNTHCHYCHAGGDFRLNKRLGYIEVIIHELDAAAVERGDTDLTGAKLHNGKFEGCEINVRVCTSDMDQMETLGFGSKLLISVGDFDFVPIHTPGHTPGSMCLYGKIDGKLTLFAGDIGEGKFRQEWKSSSEDSHSSILRLLALDTHLICPGHGMVVEKPKEWLNNLAYG